jgi:hypothetical protein
VILLPSASQRSTTRSRARRARVAGAGSAIMTQPPSRQPRASIVAVIRVIPSPNGSRPRTRPRSDRVTSSATLSLAAPVSTISAGCEISILPRSDEAASIVLRTPHGWSRARAAVACLAGAFRRSPSAERRPSPRRSNRRDRGLSRSGGSAARRPATRQPRSPPVAGARAHRPPGRSRACAPARRESAGPRARPEPARACRRPARS